MKRHALAALTIAATWGLPGCQSDHTDAMAVVVTLPDQDIPSAANATILVDYSGTGARLLAESGGPSCAFVLPGVQGDFSDDRQGTLTIHTKRSRALRARTDFAACRMEAGDPEATAASLQAKLSVRIESAEDTTGKALDLPVRAAKGRRGGQGNGGLSDAEVQAAQAEAVRAAMASAPPTPVKPAVDGQPLLGVTNSGQGAGDAFAAGGSAISQNPNGGGAGARTGGRGSGMWTGGAAVGGGGGNGAASGAATNNGTPVTPDTDPTYDDSSSQDSSVQAYSLDVAVQGNDRFGALQFEITHLGNNGGFIGRGDKIDCVPLVEAIVAGNYVGERVAKLGLISLAGIPSPSIILRCGFRTRESLSTSSFLIDVTDASDTDSVPLEPFPTVAIVGINPR